MTYLWCMHLKIKDTQRLLRAILSEDIGHWSTRVTPQKDGSFLIQVLNRDEIIGKRMINSKDRDAVADAIRSIMHDVDVDSMVNKVADADPHDPIPLVQKQAKPFPLVRRKF